MAEKKYACPTCKATFKTADALMVHIKAMHPENGFSENGFCEHSR